MNTILGSSFRKLIQEISGMPDSYLELPWAWGEYDSEGVRFALFRTYEEFQELSVTLLHLRDTYRRPMTSAQQILGNYHLAVRDLQSLLVGLESDQFNQVPGEND